MKSNIVIFNYSWLVPRETMLPAESVIDLNELLLSSLRNSPGSYGLLDALRIHEIADLGQGLQRGYG